MPEMNARRSITRSLDPPAAGGIAGLSGRQRPPSGSEPERSDRWRELMLADREGSRSALVMSRVGDRGDRTLGFFPTHVVQIARR
jgi:hypothetical protein